MSLSVSTESILKDPEKIAKTLPISLLIKFLKKATCKYETEQSIISDSVYDTIYDIIKERDPSNPFFKNIGYDVGSNKIDLPIHMGSMNKLKDPSSINSWALKFKHPKYIVSSKLDGISSLLVNTNGSIKMYTRGNGTQGRDISHIIPYINLNIKDTGKKYMVRGELIVSKQNFNTYGKNYSSSRNMINGIINKKDYDKELLKYVDYVVFELVEYDSVKSLLPHSQFIIAEKIGFNVANYCSIDRNKLLDFNTLTLEKGTLMNLLLKYRIDCKYDIDGIIVTENKEHELNKSGNPDYSFAFKSNGMGKVTKVKHVEWNISKHGQLIPRIEIEPICIDNINIKYTTGFNGKFIVENSIGKDSIVRVIRSGDVIPHIIDIIERSDKPILPDVNYIWNETGVNMIVGDKSDDLEYKRILSFFKTLKIEYVSDAIIKKMFVNGFNSIKKILSITKEKLLKLDGIQITMANKILKSIHKIIDEPIDLSLLMSASLSFGHGFGIKRFNCIIEYYPNILNFDSVSIDMIQKIDGFSHKMSQRFVNNFNNFKLFLSELNIIQVKIPETNSINTNGIFKGKNIVITGFRSKDVENYIIQNGGTIKNTINKQTHLLIVKDENYTSSKTEAALLLGIKIINLKELLKN